MTRPTLPYLVATAIAILLGLLVVAVMAPVAAAAPVEQPPDALSVALADLLSAALVALVLAATYYLRGWAKQHLNQQHYNLAEDLARAAVRAVEMMAANSGWNSEQKKQEALALIKPLAASYGIKLTDEQWSALIEAAVKALQAWGEEVKQPSATNPPELAVTPHG